jgi:hypothetical protein
MAHAWEVGAREDVSAGEVDALTWRKSMRSIGNGQCVEAGCTTDGRLAMRDSTDKAGPTILLSRREWSDFLRKIKTCDLGGL